MIYIKKSKSYEILRAERAHPKAWQPRQIPKEVLAMPQPTAFPYGPNMIHMVGELASSPWNSV